MEKKDEILKKLKENILNLENTVKKEKSEYIRKVMLENINALKKEYNAHQEILFPEIKMKETLSFKNKIISRTDVVNKSHIENKMDCNYKINNSMEVVIEYCKNVVFQYFECEGSLTLTNLDNCKIFCKAQQIRINSCKDVEIITDAQTDAYIQESSEIKIWDTKNNKGQIHDFTNPLI